MVKDKGGKRERERETKTKTKTKRQRTKEIHGPWAMGALQVASQSNV
jgi:hypothetical protein